MPLLSAAGGGSAKGFGMNNFGRLYNAATGGTITTYTVSGIKYRAHLFTSNGTFTVTATGNPFQIVLGGGGGGGGGNWGAQCCEAGGGGSGTAINNTNLTLNAQAYAVTIGGGGGGGYPNCCNGGNGGTTSLGSVISAAGGQGGGTSPGWGGYGYWGASGPQICNTYSGTNRCYAGGGGGPGAYGSGADQWGGTGGSGALCIRYEIAP